MLAIVTGGNQGMGLLTATKLCELGYSVTISCRSLDKGEDALNKIKSTVPNANVSYLLMDMADMSSVKQFATNWVDQHQGDSLSLLVNNAGMSSYQLISSLRYTGHYNYATIFSVRYYGNTV